MIEEPLNRTIVKVQEPILKPTFTNIGYGNPRYNSMIVCSDSTVLVSCGAALRKVDLKKDEVILNKQIGHSQIFQIMENQLFIIVINFEGLITLLNNKNYQIIKQFYAHGKQIRHSSVSSKYLALSCQLNSQFKQESMLEVYRFEDILKQKDQTKTKIKPFVSTKGFYYYPEIVDEYLICIQYHNPNPKNKSRVETVMEKKLPIKHKIFRGRIDNLTQDLKQISDIKLQGQILCAANNQNSKMIFYLHQAKGITIFSCQTGRHISTVISASSAPHCIEPYKQGIIFASKSSEITYLWPVQDPDNIIIKTEPQKISSPGIGGNFSIKAFNKSEVGQNNDLYLFNEYGLHLYCSQSKSTYSQNCFDITNCGISLNKDGTLFTVADFGGNVYIFTTQLNSDVPKPLTKITVGIPIRSLVWCHDSNKIVIGCVGGSLFAWNGEDAQAQFISQYSTTINILKYFDSFVVMGTSDGFINLLDSQGLCEVYKFQAHFPVNYENQKDRELFGSMKNYAEIWSVTIFPNETLGKFSIATASEDQSEKVFEIQVQNNGIFSHKQLHHLTGHSLAVTSIDWKTMGKGLNQIYVSCSDDKIVRFRNPHSMFEVIHELQTSTIKQWHTLTYLALQPNGFRVAIGSQNGYLFIFDIETKRLLFGEKIHLGGIEGLDWANNKLITCSSDLCISMISI